jgi:hypothetical protein
MDQQQLQAEILKLQAEISKIKETSEKKNHRAVRPQAGRKYVLLSKSLQDWGKVPQQQKDLASIISKSFEVGQEVSEEEVFSKVTEESTQYASLATSVQHPTYLLAYYRGLDKKDGKHAGFVRRNFFQVKG